MLRRIKTRSCREREQYFEDNCFSAPPYSQDMRFSLASEFYSNDDYETASMLFDHVVDYDHSGFLNLLGKISATSSFEFSSLNEAEKYFRRALRHSKAGEERKEISENLVSVYCRKKSINIQTFNELFSNEHLAEVVDELLSEGRLPSFLLTEHESNSADFLLAISFASGYLNNSQDHKKSSEFYTQYFGVHNRGYLKETYQNLTIRYALGLGHAISPKKALKFLKTAEIFLSPNDRLYDDVFVSVLENYAKGCDDSRYFSTAENVIAKMASGSHPFGAVEFIEHIADYNSDAVNDTIFLLSYLAHAENWKNQKYWPNMVHAAAKKAGRSKHANYDFSKITEIVEETHFRPDLIELEGKTQELSAKRIELHEYFANHDLGIPPKKQEDRYQKAFQLTNCIPPNFEGALILFDADEDSQHSNWLLLVGFMYDQHIDNEKLFDPKKAIEYYERASALGNAAASMNLGLKYEQGKEIEIDLDKARKWFELAKKQGSPAASGRIAEIQLLQESLNVPSTETKPNRDIANLYFNSLEMGDLHGWLEFSKCQLNGYGVEKDKKLAISNFAKILNKKPQFQEERLHAFLAYRMALRSCLGLNCTTDFDKAHDYLNLIPEKSNNNNIQYQAIPRKIELTGILKNYAKNSKSRHNFESAKSALISVCENDQNPTDLITQITDGSILVTRELIEVLCFINRLSAEENWVSHRAWKDLFESALATRIGLTFDDISKSTIISGPRYNPVDQNGLPILGVWEEAAESQEQALEANKAYGSFVPNSGASLFKGLTAHPEKGVSFHVEETQNLPALLLPEDFDTVMTLCFAHPERVLWPSLSLEDVDDKQIHLDKSQLQRKDFFPDWLGHTNFGKTLFTTDQLIGNWAWRSETFVSGEPELTYTPDVSRHAKAFIRDLRLTGGRAGKGGSSRVMLRPEKVDNHIYGTRQDESTSIHITVGELRMRVDGSYILKEIEQNGKIVEKRLVALNDETFQQGRTCQKLTDNFHIISKFDPRFARAEQMMRLLYAVADLREKTDYRLPDHLQKYFEQKISHYDELGELQKNQLICRRIPFLR